ncbi:hypothetical protein ACJ5NV_04725 [Loktanella agnita]
MSILHAVIFGAGEAYIDIGMASLIVAIGAFLLGVTLLQLVARRLWRNPRQLAAFVIALPLLVGQMLRGRYRSDRPDDRAAPYDGPIRRTRF